MKTVAMILAAGRGTRLAPLTDSTPKALVKVGGKPMLERVIRLLQAFGIEHFVVNVHHHAQQIVDFLKANNNFGAKIQISDETERLLDTGGAILKATPLFEGFDNILIHNADILDDIDIRRMIDEHTRNHADATLLVGDRKSSRYLYFYKTTMQLAGWQNTKTGETLPSGFVPCTTTTTTIPLAFSGVHIFSTRLLEPLKEYAPGPIFSIIPFYVSLCQKADIKAYLPREKYQWFDIGSIEKLRQAEQQFRH